MLGLGLVVGGSALDVIVEGQPAPAAVPPGATAPGATAPSKPPEPKSPLLEALKRSALSRSGAAIFSRLTEEADGGPVPLVGPPKDASEPIIQQLQRDVTRGNWSGVGEFLGRFKGPEARDAYLHILTTLAQAGPQGRAAPRSAPAAPGPAPMQAGGGGPATESGILLVADLLALADLSPSAIDDEVLTRLGGLLSTTLANGAVLATVLGKLDQGSAKLGGTDPEKRMLAARLLHRAGQAAESGRFLPTLDQARSARDPAALNLLATHFEARHARDSRMEWLENAWLTTQDVLTLTDAPRPARDEAMVRAIGIAPRLRADLGRKWLEESFSRQPERGVIVLTTIGSAAINGRRNFDAESRRRVLELQKRAVDALVGAVPQRLADWSQPLTLLALNWLHEAKWSQQRDSSTQRGPMMQYDQFGNVFFMHDDMMRQQQMMGGNREPQAIPSGQVLDAAPGPEWLDAVDPRFASRSLDPDRRASSQGPRRGEGVPVHRKNRRV